MNSWRLVCLGLLIISGTSPVFAQRPHPGGGPPAGTGSSAASGSAAEGPGMPNRTETPNTSSMMHASPSAVLSHNTVIADKVKNLTGEDAATACSGFRDLGQCVAAAHVAKNLNIPGGFDALKAKVTGTGSVNLGKAISQLAPAADAKSEAKKANKQAEQDLNLTNT
jgi:hypothetical protein